MAGISDVQRVHIRDQCMKQALVIHTSGKRNSKNVDVKEIVKTAKEIEKYVTK